MLIHEALCRDFETLYPENLRQEIRSVIKILRGKPINSLPSGLVYFNHALILAATALNIPFKKADHDFLNT